MFTVGQLQANDPAMMEVMFYDASGNVTHIGYALVGSLTSQSVWRVVKFELDGSGNVTGKKFSPPRQIADNYLTLSYS
jgi:hypothetical protein